MKGDFMATELSPELRRALAASGEHPLEVIDPITRKAYVLVSAESYARIEALLGNEGDVAQDMSRMLVDLAPEDWEDAANYDLPNP